MRRLEAGIGPSMGPPLNIRAAEPRNSHLKVLQLSGAFSDLWVHGVGAWHQPQVQHPPLLNIATARRMGHDNPRGGFRPASVVFRLTKARQRDVRRLSWVFYLLYAAARRGGRQRAIVAYLVFAT